MADNPDFVAVLRHASDEVAEVEIPLADRGTGDVPGSVHSIFERTAIIGKIQSFMIDCVGVIVEMEEIAGHINNRVTSAKAIGPAAQ